MSLSCQYDQVNSLNYLGDLVKQVAVEARLRLPENYPRVAQIKGGEFDATPPTLKVNEGALTITGQLHPHLVYLTEPSTVATEDYIAENGSDMVYVATEYGISWLGELGVGFEETIEIPGLNSDVMVEVDIRPNSVVYEQENQDEVVFRGAVDLIIHTAVPQRVEVVSDIVTQPVGRVQVGREQILVEEFTGVTTVIIPVRNTLLLPNFKPGINRIVDYFIKPVEVSSETINGKIAVKGCLEVALLYVGSDEAGRPNELFVNEWNREQELAIPFETFVDSNATGRVLAEPKIALKNVTLESQSARELRCQLDLECELKTMNIVAKDLVVEVTPEAGEVIDVEKHLINLTEFIEEAQGPIDFETTINLAIGAPEMERLLTYQGGLEEVTIETGDNQLVFNGNLNLRLYYIANGTGEQRLFQSGWEKRTGNGIPISGQLQCSALPPGALLRSRVALDGLRLEMCGARAIKVQGRVKSNVVVQRPRAFNVVQNCALVKPVDPASRPSMLFYVVQPEDTLWKIARKYETTVDTLVQNNQLTNPEQLESGRKLLIPKKIIS